MRSNQTSIEMEMRRSSLQQYQPFLRSLASSVVSLHYPSPSRRNSLEFRQWFWLIDQSEHFGTLLGASGFLGEDVPLLHAIV